MSKNQSEKKLSNHSIYTESAIRANVVWADGIQDHQRDCGICETQTCIKPTHTERYRTISDTLAKKWDDDNPVI